MNTNGNTLTIPIESTAGQKLQARLNEDRTLTALERLLTRIDTLESAVDNLSNIMDQAPGMVAMTADMVDDAFAKADASGVDVNERLQNALILAEKLTAPEMVSKLENVFKLADQMPGLVAMKIDSLDEMYQVADSNGVNVDERIKNALHLAEKVTAPEMVERMDALFKLSDMIPGLVAMGADIFDEQMEEYNLIGYDPQALVKIAKTANQALTSAQEEPINKIGGLFGMLRAIKDPDRQKALGFLMNFLKHFGKNI